MNTVKKIVRATGTGTSSALALIDARKNWLLAIGCTAVKTGTSTTTNAWGLFGKDVGICITSSNYVRVGKYSTEELFSTATSNYSSVTTGSTGSGTNYSAYCYQYPVLFDGHFSLYTSGGLSAAITTTIGSKEMIIGVERGVFTLIATDNDFISISDVSTPITNIFPGNTQTNNYIYLNDDPDEPILFLMPAFFDFDVLLEDYGIYDGVFPDAYKIVGNFDSTPDATYYINGDAYFYLPTFACLFKYIPENSNETT